jgi:hypothetical protein
MQDHTRTLKIMKDQIKNAFKIKTWTDQKIHKSMTEETIEQEKTRIYKLIHDKIRKTGKTR